MRRLLPAGLSVVAIVVAAGSFVVAVAAPATAHTSTIGPLTTSIGHVAGQVSTDAPYVELTVLTSDRRTVAGPTVQAVPGGDTVEFDLETWGMENGTVSVRACDDDTATSCDPAIVSPSFTALDVTPTITWPDDTTIGPDDEYSITVDDDASGGGKLRALWNHSSTYETPLPHDGTATIKVSDASGAVLVRRCNSTNTVICRTVVTGPTITVSRRITASTRMPGGPISPAVRTKLEPEIYIHDGPERDGPITVAWEITRKGSDAVLMSGTAADLATAQARVRPQLDIAGLDDGDYQLRATLTWTNDDYGTLSGTVGPSTFAVDGTAPTIESVTVSSTTVYPYRDRYLDRTVFSIRSDADTARDTAVIEIFDESGAVVRTMNLELWSPYPPSWEGDDGAGNSVAAGSYSTLLRITDPAGNTSTKAGPTLDVVRKRLSAARTFKRTLTPARTFQRKFVGSCSTLRRPASRGWRGSFGLYSNTRCDRGARASGVETHHAVLVPSAARYGPATISVRGGAARARPRSVAWLYYHFWGQGRWSRSMTLGWSLKTHEGRSQRADKILRGRWLYWAVVAAYGRQYDVKSFTVKVRYQVLVDE